MTLPKLWGSSINPLKMKLLLDSHVLLWFLSGEQRLKPNIREEISSPDNITYVSIASLWELTVKQTLKKIVLSPHFFETLTDAGFTILPITFGHLNQLKDLPLLHRDPFDRMLVAQAQADQLMLVTRDTEIRKYGISVLQA